jgi:hypothetical protein
VGIVLTIIPGWEISEYDRSGISFVEILGRSQNEFLYNGAQSGLFIIIVFIYLFALLTLTVFFFNKTVKWGVFSSLSILLGTFLFQSIPWGWASGPGFPFYMSILLAIINLVILIFISSTYKVN